jgi:preprotein translocase subunit SecD
MSSIRNRLIFIVVLVAMAGWGLRPREVIVGTTEAGVDSTETQWGLNLGLDLQGGMHLAVEIDQSGGPVTNPGDALDRAETVIRSRIDEFGVAEPLNPERAKEIVERSAFLEFRLPDIQGLFEGAFDRIDRALFRAGVTVDEDTTAAVTGQTAIQQILGAAADTTPEVPDSVAADSLDVAADVAAEAPTQAVFTRYLLSSPGGIAGEFFVAEEEVPRVTQLLAHEEFIRNVPRGISVLWGREPMSLAGRLYRGLYAVESRPIITGERLANAQARLDPTYNQAIVSFEMTRAGGRIFGRATAEHVQDFMAIVLDGRVQGQPPVIRSQIRRRGQIELGNASIQDAQDLALVLRAGALPAPIQIVEERSVGASLGEDSIRAGRLAGIVAVALVIGIVAVYYRLAGIMAIVALSFYVLFTLGGLATLGTTLTLPGLAGFVLSLGLAVDANVLIFERIREELALNRSPRVAVDSGFDHAMPAIIDGNLTTVITDRCVPLPVRNGARQGIRRDAHHRHRGVAGDGRLRHENPVPCLAAAPLGCRGVVDLNDSFL